MSTRASLPVDLRRASEGDVPAIHALVEAAYRGSPDGTSGWTTEAHLLAGTRTTRAEILANIRAHDSIVLVATAGLRDCAASGIEAGQVLGTVHLRRADDRAEFGMFAVSPRAQSRGVGSRLVRGADDLVRSEWGLSRIRLTVIGHRADLLSWYLRLGFAPTGEVEPFPGAATSTPLVEGIQMRVLERELAAR